MRSIAKLFPEQTAKHASAHLLSIFSLHFARADYKLVDWSIDDSVDFSDRFPSFHLIELNIKIIFHWSLRENEFHLHESIIMEEEKRKNEQRCDFCLF